MVCCFRLPRERYRRIGDREKNKKGAEMKGSGRGSMTCVKKEWRGDTDARRRCHNGGIGIWNGH